MTNAFDLLGFKDMPFRGSTGRSLYDVFKPQTFAQVCDQDGAMGELVHGWDGLKPLLLVGAHGSGKTLLAELACAHRRAVLCSIDDMRSVSDAGDFVRMRQRQHGSERPVYAHASLGVQSHSDVVALLGQRVPLILECTPTQLSDGLRSLSKRFYVCRLNSPSDAAVCAWLGARGARSVGVIAGDVRAAIIDALNGGIAGARVPTREASYPIGVQYVNARGTYEVARAADELSIAAILSEDHGAQLVSHVERLGTVQFVDASRDQSTSKVIAVRRTALRAHNSVHVPQSYVGARRSLEYAWYAPAIALDASGRSISRAHAMLLPSKRRRVTYATTPAGRRIVHLGSRSGTSDSVSPMSETFLALRTGFI